MRCPQCGRFVKDAVATVTRGGDMISKVEAKCSQHGTVEPTDWEYEDFFSENGPSSNDWWQEQMEMEI